MERLLPVLIVVAQLFVNLTSIHLCLKKKASTRRIILHLAVFSVFVLLIGEPLLSRLPGYGPGNGFFVLVGFVYLIPLFRLYYGTLEQKLIIICASWTYSLSVYAAAYQFSLMFDRFSLGARLLLFQTIIFAVTDGLYKRFMRKYFLFILRHTDPQEQYILRNSSVLGFFLLYTIHLSYVFSQLTILRLLAVGLLFSHIIHSYNMVHRIMKSNVFVRELEGMIRFDALTQLRNRNCFHTDALALIRRRSPFYLIFVDLDHFKEVNDTLGHLAGDEYLKAFSRWAEEPLGSKGTLYRLAGDEFVCLYTGRNPNTYLQMLSTSGPPDTGCKYAFRGASIGTASYPRDGQSLEHLLSAADHRMYQHKKKNHSVQS